MEGSIEVRGRGYALMMRRYTREVGQLGGRGRVGGLFHSLVNHTSVYVTLRLGSQLRKWQTVSMYV